MIPLSLGQAVRAAELAVKSTEADNDTVQANVKAASIDLEQAKDNLNKISGMRKIQGNFNQGGAV